jgi:hypothetical protein
MAKRKESKESKLSEIGLAFAEQDKKFKQWSDEQDKAIAALLKPFDDGVAKVLRSVQL